MMASFPALFSTDFFFSENIINCNKPLAKQPQPLTKMKKKAL